MYCPEFDDLMGEYALGPAELPPAERERVEAHLEQCASCRQALEGERALYARLRRAHQYIQCMEPPAAEVEEMKRRVRAAVRRRKIARLAVKILAACGSLATAVVLAVCLFHHHENGAPPPAARPASVPEDVGPVFPAQLAKPTDPREPKPAVAEPPRHVPREIRERLRELRKQLSAAQRGEADRSVLEQTARSAMDILHEYPETGEGLDAQYLVYGANVLMVETHRAAEAFMKYLDMAEDVKGRAYAARAANREGDRLFKRDRDFLASLFYHDVASQRYKDLEAGRYAMLCVGRCYGAMGEVDMAELQYRDLIERYPESRHAQDARFALQRTYANTARYDEALEALEEYGQHSKTEGQKAMADYLKAVVAMMRKDTAGAMRMLTAVLEKYQDENVVTQAADLLVSLREKALRDMEEGL